MQTVELTQEIENVGAREYRVTIKKQTEDACELLEFKYADSNSIFPAYRPLFNVIRDYKNTVFELYTDNEQLYEEVNGIRSNKNNRLLTILQNDLKAANNELKAYIIQ